MGTASTAIIHPRRTVPGQGRRNLDRRDGTRAALTLSVLVWKVLHSELRSTTRGTAPYRGHNDGWSSQLVDELTKLWVVERVRISTPGAD